MTEMNRTDLFSPHARKMAAKKKLRAAGRVPVKFSPPRTYHETREFTRAAKERIFRERYEALAKKSREENDGKAEFTLSNED